MVEERAGVSSELSPISESQRVVALDIVRAIALFGILLINVEFFTRPLETASRGIEPGLTRANHALAWFEYVFIQGKVWVLFAMLFGAGFAVMTERAQQAHRSFVVPYLRRTVALLMFGLAHFVLIWSGDILHLYAIAAGVLLTMLYARPWYLLIPVPAFLALWLSSGGMWHVGGVIGFIFFAVAAAWLRGSDPSRLWRAGAALYASVPCLMLAMKLPRLLASPSSAASSSSASSVTEIETLVSHVETVSATGSYAENVQLRLELLSSSLPKETALLVCAVGMFLIGAWLVRSGIIRDLPKHRGLLARNATIAICIGLALTLGSAAISTDYDLRPDAAPAAARHMMLLAGLPLGIGYGCALLWVLARPGDRLSWLAPAGRMALTNYLLQSLIGTMLFHGYGAGLWGKVDRIGQLLFVLALFTAQLAASHWWLRRFQFGPAEWVWRTVTYGVRPGMRRAAVATELVRRSPFSQ
jgi:uncharacterized protein